MAISLNSVVTFNSSANYQRASKVISVPTPLQLARSSKKVWLRSYVKETKRNFNLLVANTNRVETDINDKNVVNSSVENPETEADSAPEGLLTSKNPKEADNVSSVTAKPLKRSPLTAREKLRAARVLSRYNNNESKASKPDMGRKLLEVLRESEKGKKGLPEAPNNLFDDSKRGLPKPGWTWELPVGFDVFLITFSFVFISTVMFATTYIVWKVGAIHFNEN